MKHRQHGQRIEGHLEVAEIFSSIQGEGPFLGQPAIFVRLSGCIPPYCHWCDTVAAQQAGHHREVEDIIQSCQKWSQKLIVVTGGEPFLQWGPELQAIEKRMIQDGYTLQYETSGKVTIPPETRGYIVCSPKYLQGQWHFLTENIERAQAFKFVVDDGYKHIEAFIQNHSIADDKVWLMAQGAKRSEQLEQSPALWDYCVDNNYNFSPRLHVLVHDDKKGV